MVILQGQGPRATKTSQGTSRQWALSGVLLPFCLTWAIFLPISQFIKLFPDWIILGLASSTGTIVLGLSLHGD